MVRPTHTSRRSKEEREALAKEQRDKDVLRNAEREAAIKKKEYDDANKAKREARHALRARGGYSGAMSGPFSMGSSREGKTDNSYAIDGAKCCIRQEKYQPQYHIRLWLRNWFTSFSREI